MGWLAAFFIKFFWLVFSRLVKLILPIASKIKLLIRFFYENSREGSKIAVTKIREQAIKIKERLWLWFSGDKKEVAEDPALEPEAQAVLKSALLRPVLFFSLALFILIIPFKAFTYYKSLDLEKLRGEVLGASEEAISNLVTASQSASQLNFSQASQDFSQAAHNFLIVQEQLEDINRIIFVLASIAPSQEIRLAAESKDIIAAGQIASNLGNNLSLAFNSLFNNKDKEILEIIDEFVVYGTKAVADAESLSLRLKEIDEQALPDEYREQFMFLKEKVLILEDGLRGFVNIIDKLKIFLGANQDKRYLLIFQNNSELRASGGFIGSYALVDLSNGKIKNMEVPGGGSYDTEGGLRVLVAAPEPLSLVNPLWHFWDANWWPDWLKTAKKLMWFYEKSGGPTVDGVISFTPTVLENLLRVIGPVDMTKEHGVTLTAENFWITTQTIAEEKLTPEEIKAGVKHEPKKIIGDLAQKIIDELPARLNKDTFVKFLAALEESLSEKHILFYLEDEELQKEMEAQGWAGRIKKASRDYLAVINTNIAGGKSDRRMKEVINHTAEVMPNGVIINTVEIKRTHTGIKREPFSGVRNVDWMRIYVPAGSQLLEAQGFSRPDDIYFEEADESWQKDSDLYEEETADIHEPSNTKIYNESGKTVFANWSMVDPGESVTVYLKYRLPFVLEKNTAEEESFMEWLKKIINPSKKQFYPYSLFVQKQPGSSPSEINISLKLPDNFAVAWKYPKDSLITSRGWQISDKLNIDKYWAALLETE